MLLSSVISRLRLGSRLSSCTVETISFLRGVSGECHGIYMVIKQLVKKGHDSRHPRFRDQTHSPLPNLQGYVDGDSILINIKLCNAIGLIMIRRTWARTGRRSKPPGQPAGRGGGPGGVTSTKGPEAGAGDGPDSATRAATRRLRQCQSL